MSNDITVIKKEIKDFLLINFALILFISIFLFLSSTKNNAQDFAANFAILFMYIPAFSAITVLRNSSHYNFNNEINHFFKIFSICTIIRLFVTIGETFLLNSIWLASIIDTIMSIYFLYFVLVNKEEMNDINLCFGKNSKKITFVIFIFVLLVITSNIPELIMGKVSINLDGESISNLVFSLIINFLIGFNLFFGEEFGWRYFLQPRLQKLFGKKVGVLILGFIWGIWHAPLCFMLYSPRTPLYCVIGHISTCVFMGIYLGYAYMKTENVWAPMLIHMVNNVIGIVLSGGYATVFTTESLLYSILIYAIFFSPFLLTKEYKKDKINKLSSYQ